jgi:hypothetical protein
MSSPVNPMSWIMSIETLTGANYPQWREKVNMGLALFEIDKAIMDKRSVEPTPVRKFLMIAALKLGLTERGKMLSSWSATRLRRSTRRGQIVSVS